MKERLSMHPKVYKAATSGDYRSLMTTISENGEDLFHQTTPKGNNILHVAAQGEQVDFIRDILRHQSGSSLLWQGNYKGDTPLHVAAKVGNDHAIRIFTDLAKSLDQLDACKELLRRPNNNKDTSLHYALRGGHESVVKLLIEEDPQLCDIGNAVGEHPLYLAAHQRLSDIIELILHASSSPCFHRGPKGLTALHAAVHYSLPSWEKILEKRPEVIREVDDIGWTPLHYAACFGNVEAVQQLLRQDTFVVYDLDKEGESALHIAAFRGHVKIIKELVTSCPDAYDMINNKERTALHSAVIGGQAKVVKHILRTPNLEDVIDQQDTDGNTALHLAMLHREYLIVPILARDERVNCFATNKDHKTALDIYFASEEVKCTSIVYRALKRNSGFPVMQEWVSKHVKKRLDKQFVEGQPVGSEITGSDTPNRENFNSSLKSIIELEQVVAAFIVTATFAAAFTMPGGYYSDGPNQGMATFAGRAAFITFVIANALAFSFSTLALFLQFDTSALSDRKKVKFTHQAAVYIQFAALGMVLAFASGTYVVLTRTIGLAIVPWVVCGCVGSYYTFGMFRDFRHRSTIVYLNPDIFLAGGERVYGIR